MFFSRRVHCSKFYLCSFPLQNSKEKTFAYTIYVMVQGFFLLHLCFSCICFHSYVQHTVFNAYFSGHSFLTKTRLYFSFKFLGKLYCEIRRRGRLVWTVQWWDGTLVFRIDFALHYHVSEVWKANANASESTWKCFISCVCIFNFVCLSCICIFVGISLHCIFVGITRIFLEADTRPTHLLYYQVIIRIQATGGTEKHSNRT